MTLNDFNVLTIDEKLSHMFTVNRKEIQDLSLAIVEIKKEVESIKKEVESIKKEVESITETLSSFQEETDSKFKKLNKKIRANNLDLENIQLAQNNPIAVGGKKPTYVALGRSPEENTNSAYMY